MTVLVVDEQALAMLVHGVRLLERQLRADGHRLPEVTELAMALERSATVTSGQDRSIVAGLADALDAAPGPSLLTIGEAAERSRLSVSSVSRAIKTGALKTISVGAARRVHPDDLEAWWASCREENSAPPPRDHRPPGLG